MEFMKLDNVEYTDEYVEYVDEADRNVSRVFARLGCASTGSSQE